MELEKKAPVKKKKKVAAKSKVAPKPEGITVLVDSSGDTISDLQKIVDTLSDELNRSESKITRYSSYAVLFSILCAVLSAKIIFGY